MAGSRSEASEILTEELIVERLSHDDFLVGARGREEDEIEKEAVSTLSPHSLPPGSLPLQADRLGLKAPRALPAGGGAPRISSALHGDGAAHDERKMGEACIRGS